MKKATNKYLPGHPRYAKVQDKLRSIAETCAKSLTHAGAAGLAMQLVRDVLPRYVGGRSRGVYTQHQLFALVCLAHRHDGGLHSLISMVLGDSELRTILELGDRIPDQATIWGAQQRFGLRRPHPQSQPLPMPQPQPQPQKEPRSEYREHSEPSGHTYEVICQHEDRRSHCIARGFTDRSQAEQALIAVLCRMGVELDRTYAVVRSDLFY